MADDEIVPCVSKSSETAALNVEEILVPEIENVNKR